MKFTHTKNILVIVLFVLLSNTTISKAQTTSSDFEISKNLDIFFNLFKELNTNYVDDLKTADLLKVGIDAMLDDLDPYTVYIPEAEIEDYRFMTTGEYGGIGSLIHVQDNRIIISDPYENSPAQKAGLKAGDRILEVNGKTVNGKNVDDVSMVLKGQPGSKVKLLLERDGVKSPFEKEIVRDKISIESVPYWAMLNDHIGYIKLTGFTQNCANDVAKALKELRKNPGFNGLVLDLRDNGGGLMSEAINIVNLFVAQNEEVVSTKGKQYDKNRTFRTTQQPLEPTLPLVVLVNSGSASASEIVAGALQDLDRAVIIGRRTYGKGLVQNIFPLPYNTQVKITVAKYYIPSGRCIQAIDYAHKTPDGRAGNIPDSLITAFKTKNGRTVYDGKGILPDILTDTIRLSPVAINLILKYMVFDYATKFNQENPTIADAKTFELSNASYDDFLKFIASKKFEYKTKEEAKMDEFQKIAEKDGSWENLKPAFDQLKSKVASEKEKDFDSHKDEIKMVLENEIVGRYYYEKGRIEASLAHDPDIKRAFEVFDNKEMYTSILKGSYSGDSKKR